jgi:hypothetical protein
MLASEAILWALPISANTLIAINTATTPSFLSFCFIAVKI